MKKITLFFSLCLTMLFVGAMTAKAEIGDALDRTGWSVVASSWCNEDGTSGSVAVAIDGAIDTYWHSNWGGNPAGGESRGGGNTTSLSVVPEYVILDLGEVKANIGGIGYVARNGGNGNLVGNGALMGYKVYVSETEFSVPVNCTNDEKKQVLALTGEVASGTLSDADASEKFIATAAPVSGRYIMVVWLSAGGPGGNGNYHANCAELNVYGYSEDVKPTLIREIAAFQAKVDGVAVGTEYGTYTQEIIDAATAAIATAQAVVDNEASTDEQESAAIEALAEAVAAFQPAHPVGIFKLVSGNTAFYSNQGVYKALYASAAGVYGWGTVNDNSKPFYWNITVGADGKLNIQNAAYETYISGLGTLSETAVGVSYSSLGEGQFALQCGGTIHANNHNSGNGISGNIVSWSTGANAASAWIFEKVDEIPAAVEEAWVWINGDMEGTVIPAKRVDSLEHGKQYFIFNTAMNGTEDRTGFIVSNGSGLSLSKELPSAVALTRNAQSGYLWTVDTTETAGVYNIKNYEGKYVNIKGAHSETPAAIYIKDFATADAIKAGVNSLAEDETTSVANADITSADKVWVIYNDVDFSGNDKAWNGNPGTFANWSTGHPFAFYEVYSVNDEQKAALAEAQELLALTGAGYPAADAAERLALDSIVNLHPSAEGQTEGLVEAIAAYKACTNVALPEAGKFYNFKVVTKAGTMAYLNYTGSDIALVPFTEGDEIPASAEFYCRGNADGTQSFMTADAKFLVYHSKYAGVNWLQGGGSTTGFQAELDDMAKITFSKLLNGSNVAANSQADLFGCMTWYSKRGYDTGKGQDAYGNVVIKSDFSDYDGAAAPFFNNNYTSAFLLDEVEGFELPTIAFDSVSVAQGEYEELVDTVVVKFNADIFGVKDARFFVQTPRQAVALADSCITVGDSTVTIVAPAELLEGNYAANYMLVVENIFAQTSTVTLSYTKPLPPMEFVSVSPTADETVASLSTISMVFNDPTVDENSWDLGAIDETEGLIEVKNAAGEVVTTGTIGYGAAYDDIVITLATPIAEDGAYTLVLPAGAVGNNMGTVFNEEMTFAFNVLVPASVVSVDPAAGEVAEIPATITLTFSDAIDSLGYAILRTDKTPRGSNIDLMETAVVDGSTVTLAIPVADVADASTLMVSLDAVDAKGCHVTYGNFSDDMVYLEYNIAVEVDAATLEITSVEQVENNKFIVTVLDSNAVTPRGDGTVVTVHEAEDVAPVVVKNEAGDTIATAVLGYGDGMNQVEMLFDATFEPGAYTLVIPEATLWNGMYDPYASDYGVSFGATYNAEYTHNFTVAAPEPAKLTITGITPDAAVAKLSTITMTFSEAIAAFSSDTPKLTDAAGATVYKFKGTDAVFGADGTTVTLTIPETADIKTGEYKLVVDAGIYINATYSKVNEAAEFTITVDTTVGIDGVEADEANAAIYDLAGRRVNATVKGGVYVKNGKKFIAE